MSQLQIDQLSLQALAAMPSASIMDLENATGDLIDISGTTSITRILLQAGHERTVRFTGILTLTHGANLVLPGAANITTAAGDFAIFRGYLDGVVRCVTYTTASGGTPGDVDSVFGRTGAVTATAGDYTAAEITNVAAGGIVATDVQAAINELDTEKIDEPAVDAAGVLTSDGAGARTWEPASGGITNGAANNVIPKSDGTNIVASRLTDTGTGNITTAAGITTTTGAITTSQPFISHTATWNDAGVTFANIVSNVTDTASAAASKLIDLQVGSTTKFGVTKAGVINPATATVIGDSNSNITLDSGTGLTELGNIGTGAGRIEVDGSTPSVNIHSSGGALNMGDVGGLGTSTTILLDDTGSGSISLNPGSGLGTLTLNALTLAMYRTITAAGTTGAQTINRPAGTVNLAAGASSVTVTNSVVTTSSLIFVVMRTNDATAAIKSVVASAGSFVINMTTTCTAETSVGFLVLN